MLFMIIERPRSGNFKAVGDRFKMHGRMLPDGVIYSAIWIDARNARCFQVMEVPDQESLEPWI